MVRRDNDQQGMSVEMMFTLLRVDIKAMGDKVDALEARVREQNGRIGKSESNATAIELRVAALEKINTNAETRPVTRGQVQLVWWTLATGFSVMTWLALKFGPVLVKLTQQVTP